MKRGHIETYFFFFAEVKALGEQGENRLLLFISSLNL